jgi:N-acetylmuramoyl-L-alanine amidase
LLFATGGDDLAAKSKKSSKKTHTTKVTSSKKSKSKTKTRSKSKRSSRAKRRSKSKKSASRTSYTSSRPVVVLGSTDPIDEPEPFVLLPMVKEIPQGLDGHTIAIWPSHGKYFSGAWVWQRPRLFGTVEDLLSRSFVDPYIVPMLENAGAYVMMPRERDFSKTSLIIDHDWSSNDGRFASTTGKYKWEVQADSTGFGHRKDYIVQGENPFLMGKSGKVQCVSPEDSVLCSTAQWYGTPTEEGMRAVYVSYQSYPNSATDAVYTVNHLGGSSQVYVNQRMGGGTWVYIGSYPFSTTTGKLPLVTLSNISNDEDAVVSADAVRIGGGMGTVARSKGGTPKVSGVPAYLEGARYYLQASGFPEEVYSVNRGDNDYIDDYTSRAHWVNWLTGGSEMFPDTLGLKVPIDLALAFHTDAGVTTDSTTIGTLGLYSTDGGNPLGNGTSRYANRDLTQAITSQVISDIRHLYDPHWNSRGNLDKRYYEVRATKVPAMIIEALSHQNFEDMKHALDPEFRFIVGRAIYKGILRFVAQRYDIDYTVQPLPVEAFAIQADGNGYYTLNWRAVEDPIEASATPKYYIVYEATPELDFHPVAVTDIPAWTTQINDNKIHAYYVVAGNDGGVSFPSETLALFDNQHQMPSVTIVNGFTRVAATPWVDGSDYAGFEFGSNYGVPDGEDVQYIGEMYDFNPSSKLYGSHLGFGGSNETEAAEKRIGNTHDYPIIHGEALRKAGRGFISSSLLAFEQSNSTPKAVDLILGLQKSTRKAGSKQQFFPLYPEALRSRIEEYRAKGGTLLVSGSYLSSEIAEADSVTRSTLASFAADMLGYQPYLTNDSIPRVPQATSSMKVVGGEQISGTPLMKESTLASFKTGNWAGAGNPQAIMPVDYKGLVVARYADTGYPAAIAVEGGRTLADAKTEVKGRTVVAGFPLEAVESSEAREDFIAQSIQYLIGDEPKIQQQSADKNSHEKGKKKDKKNKKNKKKK